MINRHENVANPAGVKPATSQSPVRRASNWATKAGALKAVTDAGQFHAWHFNIMTLSKVNKAIQLYDQTELISLKSYH